MARSPQASNTIPYLPALLEANALEMSAEICSTGDHMQPQEGKLSEELTSFLHEVLEIETSEEVGLLNLDNWQEISFLEFVNASLPAQRLEIATGGEALERATGPTSQPVIPVITSKEKNLTWRGAVDSDNHNGESIFQTESERLYVRTSGDVRILYENRPERMGSMVLAEFSARYRLLWPSHNGFEKVKDGISEETLLGPDTDELVAGTHDIRLPEAMMLKNGKVMKKRQDGIAVPNLLFFGCSSSYGNQMMYTPWRQLEDIAGDEEEDETPRQKDIRLEIFPCSVFPPMEGEIEEE